MSRITPSLLVFLVAAGCTARDATGPMSHDPNSSTGSVLTTTPVSLSKSSARSGALHVTKECSEYTGLADSFCTITSSNLKEIPVGSRIVYATAAGATSLDTDIVLDPPSRGNNAAFGHCTLVFSTGTGQCTFSGGTGMFRKFHARVDVSYLGGPNWAWNGTYSFSPKH
jgi:hypothetical protein